MQCSCYLWTVSSLTVLTLPCVLSPFRFHGFALSYAVSAHLRFALPAVRYSMEHTFELHGYIVQPFGNAPFQDLCLLWLLLTSHSSLLLRYIPACETSRDKPGQSFPRSTCLIYAHGYGCLLDFAVFSKLIRRVRLVSDSCSSGYDFAIPSSRLHLTMQTLGVAMGFVGNYAPCGLSPQTDGMPVILKKALGESLPQGSLFLFSAS